MDPKQILTKFETIFGDGYDKHRALARRLASRLKKRGKLTPEQRVQIWRAVRLTLGERRT